jgi:hypothetical protein
VSTGFRTRFKGLKNNGIPDFVSDNMSASQKQEREAKQFAPYYEISGQVASVLYFKSFEKQLVVV